MNMKGVTGKETVYVDVDDEITGIIDKVVSSRQKIVALVLPKRSAVLQSIVNMRLLKRSADDADKKVVLITSEAGLLPLAGTVGLHVARTLQSKPDIPEAPAALPAEAEEVTELEDTPIDLNTPVGELAQDADATETIALEDETAAPPPPPQKKNKKLAIPNFDKFRLRLLLLGLALLLLFGFGVYALVIAPKASVLVRTDSTPVSGSLEATTSGSLTTLDEAKKILPAQVKERKQTATEKAAATGQKDLGTKAKGSISITNCEDSNSRSLSAGVVFSSGGKNFVSTKAATVPGGVFAGGGTICLSSDVDVNVQAAEPGESYNVDSANYTSNSAALKGNFKMKGSDMTGGTTKLSKVVAQQDIDNARQKIAAKTGNTQAEFYRQLESEGFFILEETATSSEPKITSSPAIGEEGSEATVTEEVTYSVLAVKRVELEILLKTELNKQIDSAKQQLSGGNLLEGATVRVIEKRNATDVSLTVRKETTAIPIFNTDELKKEIFGKKPGEVESSLSSRPGVKEVQVKLSPFWVSSVPKKAGAITLKIEPVNNGQAAPEGTADNNQTNQGGGDN